MREGWEYKKIGELCAPKKQILRAAKVYSDNDEIQYIDISSIDNICQKMTGVTEYVMSEAPSRAQQCVTNGDIIVSTVRPNLKNIAIVESDDDNLVASSGFCVLRPTSIERNYLFHYITSEKFTEHLNKLTTGANYPAVRDSDVLDSIIPLPPLSTQLTIVSELDKINELIRLKKEQLKDYDNLAQSIFYEMFGDPVENEKGWEVKKFSEIYKLKSGDGLSAKDFREGCIPVYGGNGISGFHDTYNMDGSFIIIGRVGVYCGNVREVSGKFWLTDNAFQLFYDNTSQYPTFIHYLLELLDLHQYANAAAQPVISNLTLKGVNIIIPPLALQQIFASRINQIEAQKEEVQSAINDLETLLASRMQFWFDVNEAADSIVSNYYSEKLIEDRYDEMFPQGHHSMEVNYGERQKCVVNDIDFKLLAQAYNHILDNGANTLENINNVIYPTLDKAHFCVLVELGLIATEDYKTFNIPL